MFITRYKNKVKKDPETLEKLKDMPKKIKKKSKSALTMNVIFANQPILSTARYVTSGCAMTVAKIIQQG